VVRNLKVEQMRQMTDEEIDAKLKEYKEELFNLRFRMATGQLDNPMQLRAVRKSIARVKTIQRERELAALKEAQGQ
jgi:large subunit ribosomal protein L29